MLISISEILETPVSILLGDNIEEVKENDLKVIAEKLKSYKLTACTKNGSKTKTNQRISNHSMCYNHCYFLSFNLTE